MLDKHNNILVFDTTTTACTVALKTSKGVFSKHKEEANIHSQALLTMIDELLTDASLSLKEIDYLAVGVGPGSFTGLRIGIGVAQGLAYSNQIELIPISTLEMIALNAFDSNKNIEPKEKIIVAHDARMSEVYSSVFMVKANSRLVSEGEVLVSAPEDVAIPEGKFYLCGNAWNEYADSFNQVENFKSADSEEFFPSAKKVITYIEKNLQSFETIDWRGLQPMYVRNNVAKKAKDTP